MSIFTSELNTAGRGSLGKRFYTASVLETDGKAYFKKHFGEDNSQVVVQAVIWMGSFLQR